MPCGSTVQKTIYEYFNGGGGGQGGLNLPLLVPFNPCSRPVFVGSRLFAFFRLQNIAQCCVIFPFFSRFPPPWESRFPPPLLPPPVHLPPPFLPVSRPLSPPPTLKRSKEFVVRTSSGRLFLRRAPLQLTGRQFLVSETIIYPWRREDHNSRFSGQTNYRDKLRRDYYSAYQRFKPNASDLKQVWFLVLSLILFLFYCLLLCNLRSGSIFVSLGETFRREGQNEKRTPDRRLIIILLHSLFLSLVGSFAFCNTGLLLTSLFTLIIH